MAKVEIVMKGSIVQDGKRRYMQGITSGTETDHHGENMTERCIKSFMEQANSGDILLYPDVHGIKASEDIGILEESKIMPNNDWYTKYRLFDENDLNKDLYLNKLEKIDALWKQALGLPPYNKARPFGFSIEGNAAGNDIIERADGGRALDNVELDGVVLVPRPAYPRSVAFAVSKALGMQPQENTIASKLSSTRAMNDMESNRWEIESAFSELIDECLKNDPDNTEKLAKYFDDYRDAMIPVLQRMGSMKRVDGEDPYRLNKAELHGLLSKKLIQLIGGIRNGSTGQS